MTTITIIQQRLTPAPIHPTIIATGVTATSNRSVLLTPRMTVEALLSGRRGRGKKPYLTAEEYPALAEIWDNEEDDIFDTL